MPNDTIETTDTVAARAVADQIATDVTTVVDARVDERLAAHETQLAAREDALVERLVERLAPPAATTAGDPPPRVEVTLDAGDRPFRSLGEQLQAVATASTPGVELDPRLARIQAAASGLNTGAGADGGFLVQTAFARDLLARGREASMLYDLCRLLEVGEGFDAIEAPYIEETSRATGSRWGGVRVYRRAEAETVAASRPKFAMFELRLEDLMGVAYASDRSLRDAQGLESIVRTAFESEFAFAVDDEIINGSGAGQCEGVLNAAALVTQAKETGQTAATVKAENIIKMRSRLWPRGRSRAVWLINADVEPELHTMSLTIGTGGVPVYLPAGGLSEDGLDRLYGRPIIPLEQCAPAGTKGDVILADFSQYALLEPAEQDGPAFASSIHVRFLHGERTFRFLYRINGAPIWRQALTPYKGSATQSPFVALATRS